MNFFEELKRRNVFRVGIAYVVLGWVVLQGADFLLDLTGAPEWIIRVFAIAGLVGLPFALFFAWAFELTPEGVKREEDVDRSASVTPQTGHKLNVFIAVMLFVALGFFVWDRFSGRTEPVAVASGDLAVERPADRTQPRNESTASELEKSIAVLPFVNMSNDPEQEYFSDGISEEILNVLTYIPDLKVAARTSSFQFKGQNQDIADIGRRLQVGLLLEGSVRKAGDQIRVTAQLIQVEDGFHVWSRTFDRRLEDVFAIQDEIAQAIADELRATFTSDSVIVVTPVDIKAYELFLKGRGLIAQRTEKSILAGIDFLSDALEIAPDYAPAMAAVSVGYAVLPWFSYSIPVGTARETARGWAEKALAIEPDNVEALSVLGMVSYQTDFNWKEGGRLLERAVRIAPGNVTANNFLGDFLERTGDLERSLVFETRAAELDPLGVVQWMDMANIHLLLGRYDEALDYTRRVQKLDPGFFSAFLIQFDVFFALGDLDALKQVMDNVRSTKNALPLDVMDFEIKLHYAMGEYAQAQALMERRLSGVRENGHNASFPAEVAVFTRDFDTAGELLQLAADHGDGLWTFPLYIRLPEQAPDSEAWQAFWSQPRLKELAALRRAHGFTAQAPTFGIAASP